MLSQAEAWEKAATKAMSERPRQANCVKASQGAATSAQPVISFGAATAPAGGLAAAEEEESLRRSQRDERLARRLDGLSSQLSTVANLLTEQTALLRTIAVSVEPPVVVRLVSAEEEAVAAPPVVPASPEVTMVDSAPVPEDDNPLETPD